MPPKKALTVVELKGLASKAGLKNYSKLDKAGLIEFLKENKVRIPSGPVKAVATAKAKAATKPKATTSKPVAKPKAATKPKVTKPKVPTKPATKPKAATPKVVLVHRWSYETSEVAGAMCEGTPAPEAWMNLNRKLSDKIEKKFLEGKATAKVKHHKASYEVTFGDAPTIKGRIHLPDHSYTYKTPLRRA